MNVSHQVFSTCRMVQFTEIEWAIPREVCTEALTSILDTIERRGFDVNFPIEVRFAAADTQSMLSPSYGGETAYIAAHAYKGMPWREYFAAFEDIAAAYGASVCL